MVASTTALIITLLKYHVNNRKKNNGNYALQMVKLIWTNGAALQSYNSKKKKLIVIPKYLYVEYLTK